MMSKKVLILAGDAVEALEFYYPCFRVLEESFEAGNNPLILLFFHPTVKRLPNIE